MKYKLGDEVKIIRGDWTIINNKLYWFNEDRIGSTAIVTEAHVTQDIDYYALSPLIDKSKDGIKYAWYNNADLELVNRPNYGR